MKTIHEWLKDLPDGYRELALANMLPEQANIEVPTLTDAIWHGMGEWIDTPQKGWFWSEVHDWSVGDGKYPLPALPPKEYTLEEAIEKLGKEGWEELSDTMLKKDNWKLYRASWGEQLWYFQYPNICEPDNFPTAPAQLQSAIDACLLLNGAKKETV